MRTTFTARHGDIPDDLKQRAIELVERVAARAHRPTSAQVTFETERLGASAEIILHAARGAVHVAKADAADHRAALDKAVAKLQRQLDKAETPARRARGTALS